MTEYPPTVPQSEELEILCEYLPPMPLEMTVSVLNAVIFVCGTPRLKEKLRNKQMLSEFTGHNVLMLCRKYRITKNYFYVILRKERVRKRDEARKGFKKVS